MSLEVEQVSLFPLADGNAIQISDLRTDLQDQHVR